VTGGVRHIVLFRWADGASDADLQAVSEGLAGLPAAIPQIRAYHYGADLCLADGNWDFGLVAEFDSVEDWATYRDDPVHQAFIAERIRPILRDRVAVQLPR
jgi:hypothetical protein